jgi:hypothetical protein
MNFFHMKESNRTCNHLKNSDFYRLDQFIVGSCEIVLLLSLNTSKLYIKKN